MSGCILCAHGNDLPEGEYCRACGYEAPAYGQETKMTLLQKAEWNTILVGGNHLANYLIGRLGAGFSDNVPPTMDSDEAREKIGDADAFDVWCGWAAIMRARGWPAPHGE